MERKIGDVFPIKPFVDEYGDKIEGTVEVVEDLGETGGNIPPCNDCAFWCCSNKQFKITGECSAEKRKDGKNVIFKLIELEVK